MTTKFTVEVSRTTSWEPVEWEETGKVFETEEEAENFGQEWCDRQEPVEFFDGFHSVGTWRMVAVNKSL